MPAHTNKPARRTEHRGTISQTHHTSPAARADARRVQRQPSSQGRFAQRPIAYAVSVAVCGIALAVTDPQSALAQTPSAAQTAQSPSQHSADARQRYSIPAGPLAPALRSLASTANVLLTFTADQTNGKTTAGVSGQYAPQEALAALLAGTGLQAVQLDNGGYVLKVVPVVPMAHLTGDEPALPTVMVRGQQESDWIGKHGSAVTKTPTPLRDVAQSVQVMTREQIDSLGAQSVKDVLEHVSGVSAGQGEGRREEFYIRGFYSPRDNTIDGVRDDNLYYRDLANVEQIEVIKGPAAALNGRGSAGGLINRVTKKPVAERLLEVGAEVGSYDQRRITIDTGGALADSVKSRLNFAYQAGDSYRDVIHGERVMIAPSVSFAISPATEVLLQAEWQKEDRTPDRGQPSVNGKPADVPAHNFYGEAYDYTRTEQSNVRLRVDHAASDDLRLSNTLQYSNVDLDGLNTRNRSVVGSQVRRQIVYFPTQQRNLLNQTEAVWTLRGGAIQHTLLTGLELAEQERDTLVRASGNGYLVDINNPAHVLARPDVFALPKTLDTSFTAKTLGVYVQDQMTLSPQWKAQAGIRFDRFDQRQTDHIKQNAVLSRVDNTWSPRAGLVYQPAETQSYYLTLSRSYQPVGSDLLSTEAAFESIKPLQTDLQEIGAKLDWLNGKLSTTVALYRLTQRNQLTTDPTDTTKKVQVGEQRSEGLELDATGRITRTLSVMASYAYTNARITASNDSGISVGNWLESTPRQSASLWFDQKLSQGWGVAAGAVYAGNRYALSDNSVKLPAYTRYDMAVYWRSPQLELKLKLNNLTDVRYAESANNNVQIGPGAPRNVVLSAKFQF